MNRRDTVLAMLALGAAPLAAVAQQPGKVWRVGFLTAPSRPASIDADTILGGLLRGMRELGYVEGRNLSIEWRFADGQPDRLAPLAAELARLNVDVIVTMGSPATFAVQKATSTIPIVFVGPGNPVGMGLVKSLARPGGNTTGLMRFVGELYPKRLEMLLALTSATAPAVSRVAFLLNPHTSASISSF